MNPQIRRRVCSSLLWLCTLSVVLLYQPSVWAALGQNDQANRLNLQEMTPTLLPGSTAPLQNIIQLAIGNSHTCALTNRGGVQCWGFNAYGQVGDGSTVDQGMPVEVAGLTSGVRAIIAGGDHTCALTTAGGVKCWGFNGSAQLGDNSTTNSSVPVEVVGLTSGVEAISAGGSHTCALMAAGGIQCWGSNTFGQLGDNSTTQRSTPVAVSGLSGKMNALSAGKAHTCVVTSTGGVKCWGSNEAGQLGDNSTTPRKTPVDVVTLSSGVQQISAGGKHTCALTNAGGVKCWGWNFYGQLGDGAQSDHYTPADVTGLTSGVQSLSSGADHACAVTVAGGVKCWGRNEYAQLGDGTQNNQNKPVDVINLSNMISTSKAGGRHTCVLTQDSKVKCWGDNSYGQLGIGMPNNNSNVPVDVTGLNQGVAAISASGAHTCVVTDSGAVKCWGSNYASQLGDGTYRNSGIPVDVINLNSIIKAISTGNYHTCALTNADKVKCWGSNSSGQLGDGTQTDRVMPMDTVDLGSAINVVSSALQHTCALLDTGGVKCWGADNLGQLGDGVPQSSGGLVNVAGLSSGISTISVREDFSCALTIGGGVKCWGSNNTGQLGDGTQIDGNSPVDVGGLSNNVKAITTGAAHACALTKIGTVKCWGRNDLGQLGDLTTKNSSIPVDVVALNNEVIAITAGLVHTCVLTDLGGVQCWGGNSQGSLGDGTYTNRAVPVNVVGLTSRVMAISAGYEHACALIDTGAVKCWGFNNFGVLGDGGTLRAIPVEVIVELTPTPTPTDTPTATPTATATPTPTNTPTSTPTPPPTHTPSGAGDTYETDDQCSLARLLAPTDAMHEHTFHAAGDVDWVVFNATVGAWYLVEAEPPASSPANLAIELYTACAGALVNQQDHSFANGVRLEFQAPNSGPLYLKLTNHDPNVAGPQVRYELSLRSLPTSATTGALILVAGSISDNDTLQPNIYYVTDAVRRIFLAHGYDDEHIYYLAPDATHPNVDATATVANLQSAITTWATDKVGPGRPLTLYLMDHGDRDMLYLHKPSDQILSPTDLDRWLAQLEAQQDGLVVNVIIEACYAGSFISAGATIARPGRVVITSTSDDNPAWASLNGGAVFSDKLIEALGDKSTLATAFRRAQEAAHAHQSQAPWLDGNGNARPNESADFAIAAERGFGIPGSFSDHWPPLIAQVSGPAAIENGRGQLRAQVLDDGNIKHVWVVIYPPSYTPPTDSEALVRDEDDSTIYTMRLQDQGEGWYGAIHAGFSEGGVYRVVFYGEDDQGLNALPVSLVVVNGNQVTATSTPTPIVTPIPTPVAPDSKTQSIFLPMIIR